MARTLATVLALLLVAAVTPGAAGSDAGAPRTPGLAASDPVTAAPLPAPPGRTTLLSRARDDGFPDDGSIEPAMSADGRFVAFTSVASDLVANDEPGSVEVFLLDRANGTVRRAPLPAGIARNPAATMTEPAISADGRVVAYTFTPAATVGVAATVSGPFVLAWDRRSGDVEVVSVNVKGGPQVGGRQPSVSADGRYIAYTTTYDLPGDKDDSEPDVLRFDRRTGTTVLVSASFSGDAFAGTAGSPSISGDGNLVAYVSDGGDSVVDEDTGGGTQVYVRDMRSGATQRVSAPPGGNATNGRSIDPAISGNGRYVAFASQATNLTPEGAGGLFRRDLRTGRTIMVSVAPNGSAGKGASAQPSITEDGNMVAWTSTASNLVPETLGRVAPAATTKIASDVFIRDIAAGETLLVSVSLDNGPGLGQSFQPAIGGGGRFVAFASSSEVLVRRDRNKAYDVFLRDLPPVPVINPATLDLGAAEVGTESLPLAATLGNGGWTPLRVTGASVTGADRNDFRVVADGCSGRTLRRNEACTVSVVFAPRARGARTATLAVADAFDGSPRTVRLRGAATETVLATLELSPEIGPPGIVTMVEGSGFPPSTPVRLTWDPGITGSSDPVVTDARGNFRVPMLVFHNDRTGRRDLLAEPVTAGAFPRVSATMLVTKPPVVPPRFEILRLIDVPLVLVFRG